MKIKTDAFENLGRIPPKYAFCEIKEDGSIGFGQNINPGFKWSDLPEGTKSLVLICHDSKVPTSPENVNKKGKVVPKDLPRTDFYHWVLVNIPSELNEIKEGEFSSGVTSRGKQVREGPHGTLQGINDYTNWFKGDENMEGDYYGYDGPCPPWNDELIHEYHFTLYALDTDTLQLPEKFTGPDVLKAIEGHILDKAVITGTYTLNKDLL